jgi:2-dehydro-3-deoxygluconokinase
MAGVIAIGECMAELSLTGPASAAIGYAGDTYNSAVYLRRLGLEVAYASAVGQGDPFSAGILATLAEEGIGRDLVVEAEGRLPGLYAIQCDANGERSFHFWRSEAPARDYLKLVDLKVLAEALKAADLIVVSAIGLAVIGEAGRATLDGLLAEATKAGAAVAFDTNYRARLWPGREVGRAAIEAVLPHCRYLSLGAEDVAGFKGRSAEAMARTWAARGVEVVLRHADHRIEVLSGEGAELFPPQGPVAAVVDTTGAGDSFNAGYWATRLRGGTVADAVTAGRALASVVVGYPGAIVPKSTMPQIGSARTT